MNVFLYKNKKPTFGLVLKYIMNSAYVIGYSPAKSISPTIVVVPSGAVIVASIPCL